MHVCQCRYSCWEHHWNMLAGRFCMASLVESMTSSAGWNLYPRRIDFMWRKRQKSNGARSGEYRGCGKMVTCCLASSSWTRTERCAYDELNCLNDQGSPCRGFCLEMHLLRWIPCKQFHLNKKKQYKHHLAFWPVLSWFFLSWWYWHFPGGRLLLQVQIIQETPCFVSSYDPVEKRQIIVSTTDQVTTNCHAIIILVSCQDVWYTVLGNMWQVQVISQNFVAHTMVDPTAAARLSSDWEWLACTNIATSSILHLVWIIFSRPVRTSSSKLPLLAKNVSAT